ncbi:hypothetical protein B0T21DRAFT_350770 [Apiosordaria backusii]|uniref:Uncharacterized protein n=1 Tax=Apiosordaria backusii TaxID=314023 RepID=A0AA40B392_9PEZI|nr:hypothetical protein B0T21DRAFT_350770 [Apiosordaria backusii]
MMDIQCHVRNINGHNRVAHDSVPLTAFTPQEVIINIHLDSCLFYQSADAGPLAQVDNERLRRSKWPRRSSCESSCLGCHSRAGERCGVLRGVEACWLRGVCIKIGATCCSAARYDGNDQGLPIVHDNRRLWGGQFVVKHPLTVSRFSSQDPPRSARHG